MTSTSTTVKPTETRQESNLDKAVAAWKKMYKYMQVKRNLKEELDGVFDILDKETNKKKQADYLNNIKDINACLDFMDTSISAELDIIKASGVEDSLGKELEETGFIIIDGTHGCWLPTEKAKKL